MFICPGEQTICHEPVVDQIILTEMESCFIQNGSHVKMRKKPTHRSAYPLSIRRHMSVWIASGIEST